MKEDILYTVGEDGAEVVTMVGGGVESRAGAGEDGALSEMSSDPSSLSRKSFLSAGLKCLGSCARWMDRPRLVSKFRPQEQVKKDLAPALLPLTGVEPSVDESAVPLTSGSESLGGMVASTVAESCSLLLDPEGVEVEGCLVPPPPDCGLLLFFAEVVPGVSDVLPPTVVALASLHTDKLLLFEQKFGSRLCVCNIYYTKHFQSSTASVC